MAEDSPDYLGHRARLRDRFLNGGGKSMADYELLELLLTYAIPRRDVKPIAKDIVTNHGGRIWAQSQGLGKGASFNFTLPVSGN